MSVDNHTIDLINRSLDGELSESEKAEYEATLAGSDEARAYSKELSGLISYLESTPAEEPPAELQRSILTQIELPRPRKWFTWAAGWMAGRPVTYGVAAGAGLLAAVAFYELSPSASPMDLSNLVGTLSRDNGQLNVAELGKLDVNAPGLNGQVLLRGEGDLRFLQFDINSDQANEFHVALAGTGLKFGGIAHPDVGGKESFSFSEGNFSVSNFGTTKFTVILTGLSGENMGSKDVVVSVTREGEGIYRGALSH
ncbi:MAG TPA: hypothetical protein VJ984_07585 [Xanthomonadales bacterium]|nr:hypothetical protein [Xanthomonadales bacterium]